MKLLEALRLINEASASERPVRTYALACGFTPLALETFVRAHLQRRRADVRVDLTVGLFGDLAGNVERAAATAGVEGVAVVVEWSDLDPRLGWRSGGLGGASFAADVVESVRGAVDRLARRIEDAAVGRPLVVCGPTLPIPPVFLAAAGTATGAALGLRAASAEFSARLAAARGVRVIDPQVIDLASPLDAREDLASDLVTGFPYHRAHAEVVAGALAAALHPVTPKKGVITDLDDTLWRGIVGEVGAAGVQWGLEHGAQTHVVYQRALAGLAEAGVLVGVASKNEPTVVEEALRRRDLLLPRDAVFPVQASWGPKSSAVAAILDAWNVGPESIIFVDDSPLEIAEVQARFRAVEGLRFDGKDAASVGRLVTRLYEAFGKDAVRDEDRLRVASLRAAATMRAAAADQNDAEAFLAQLGARLTLRLSRGRADARAFELVNKTNQFNLNGLRWTEGAWGAALDRPGAFLLTAAYEDKYGPLGKIAAALGTAVDGVVRLDAWVLSCRAFSRRVEDAVLWSLFDTFGAAAVVLDAAPTPRNGPTQELIARYAEVPAERGDVHITREAFERLRPALAQEVTVQVEDGGAAATTALDRAALAPVVAE